MNFIIITYKTIIFYFFIMLSYRLMGKREIGQLGVMDLIISILIAELAAISIENYQDTILLTIIPITTLVLLEITLAKLSIKSNKIRTLLDGKPSTIICNGILNYREMTKLRYSIDDLLLQLRQNKIKSIEEVEYAFLEPNGKLSVFPYNKIKIKTKYPMPLIVDSKINYDTLKIIKKNKNWLDNILNNNNINIEDILYAFYNKNKIFYIRK